MVSDHQLPEELNPVGDICVPLFIPAHPDYVALLLGALRVLESSDYYEMDDNQGELTVGGQWRTRTITPLINALASEDGCGASGGSTMIVDTKEYELTSSIAKTGTVWDNVDSDLAITTVLNGNGITQVAMSFNSRQYGSVNLHQGSWRIAVDNTIFGHAHIQNAADGASNYQTTVISTFKDLSAGSHTFSLQWKTTANTTYLIVVEVGMFVANLFEIS